MSMRKPVSVESLRPPTASMASEPRAEASVEPSASLSGGSPADDAADASSAAATAAVVAAAVAAVNGMEAVERMEERGGKKSAAFSHTRFHRLASDARGKEFERRMCRYCDAVFSFKGGTTSAALRHLKAAHPERVLASGPNVPHAVVLPQQQMEQQQQQQILQRQLQQQQVGGAVDRQTTAQQEQQTTDGETGSNGDGSSVSDAAVETAAASVDVLNASGGDSTAAEASTAPTSTPPTDEDANYYAQKERKLRSILKRKRESGSFDVDAVTRAGSPSASDASTATTGPSTPQKGAFQPSQPHAAALQGSPAQLTASQVAITHVLQHYKDALPVTVRLQLARHLTHNVGEAEMYNVLDDATREAYVHEFAAAVGGDSGNRASTTTF